MNFNSDDKKHPVVSIVIPAYGGADTIGDAVASVLNQSYPHLECLVVNDCSPDNTNDVLAQFSDPRLVVLQHETNQGANAARQTALAVAAGEFVAFLDQDDLYHPEKLAIIVDYFEKNPEIGAVYNGRFDIYDSPDDIFRIWMPPARLSLTDMIISFPFAPSDTVFRRQWALQEDIWDWKNGVGQEVIVNGGEYIYCGRLTFAGCKFAGIERALNYRRHHPGRVFSDLSKRCQSELTCQKLILDDPRCPPETRAAADLAYAMSYRIWAYFAFAQGEFEIGKGFLEKAVALEPGFASQPLTEIIDFMIFNSLADKGRNFEHILNSFFDHLPRPLSHLAQYRKFSIARAYLLGGLNHILWGRVDEGETYLRQANALEAAFDKVVIQKTVYQIVKIEKELGVEWVEKTRRNISRALTLITNNQTIREFNGELFINQAFQSYSSQNYTSVPPKIAHAIGKNPGFLTNRGVLSIFANSLFRLAFSKP